VPYSDEQRALAQTSPAGLALATSSGRWTLTRHLDFIDELIVNAIAGAGPDRIILSTPPRHGKSELVSRHLPPWFLGMFPHKRVLLATYEADFAAQWGRKARDMLEEHGLGLYGVKVSDASRAANRWDIEATEGGMATAGIGGPLTGKGADLFIIDDPVKNAEEAQSETIRQKHWDWWQSTASTRLHPGAVVVVVMTRWHEDDLAGRMLAGEDGHRWTEIRLPALAEGDDPLGRDYDTPLWPERFDRAWMDAKRIEVGSYWFNALYQGRPTAVEGDIFKRPWWQYYDRHLLDFDPAVEQWQGPHFTRLLISFDTSFKDKTTSDFVVGQLWGAFGPQRWLLRQVRGRMGLVDATTAARDLIGWANERWPAHTPSVFIENTANGPEVIAALRKSVQGVIPVSQSVDKVTRAMAVTPQLEAGNVYIPGDRVMTPAGWAPDSAVTPAWVQELVDECAGFPNAANDDQVDALTQALDPRRLGAGRKPRMGGETITSGVRARGT